MEQYTPPKTWKWQLCTRTKMEDYFWIDDSFRPIDLPDLYTRVGDESSLRTGYFLLTDDHVEMAVSDLDAKRQDHFGRHIRHILILRAAIADDNKAQLLRRLFAEAISTDVSDEPAAAFLARELYEKWAMRKDKITSSDCDWFDVAERITVPAAMSSGSILHTGRQYTRTPDALRHIAVAALLAKENILLLCAATNPVDRLWPIPSLAHIPTVVCACTVKDDASPLATMPSRPGIGRKAAPGEAIVDAADAVVQKTVRHASKFMRNKFGICIIVIAALILAIVLLRRQSPRETGEDKSGIATVEAAVPVHVTGVGILGQEDGGAPDGTDQPDIVARQADHQSSGTGAKPPALESQETSNIGATP